MDVEYTLGYYDSGKFSLLTCISFIGQFVYSMEGKEWVKGGGWGNR